VDKYGQNMDMNRKLAGRRLQLARGLKDYSLKDLASKFNVSLATVQRWQNRELPKYMILLVAELFKVEDWVFWKETLTDKEFQKIIIDPNLQDKYRPIDWEIGKRRPLITTFIGKYEEKKSSTHESNIFHVSCKSVLITAQIVAPQKHVVNPCQVSFCKVREKLHGIKGSTFLPSNPILYVMADEPTETANEITNWMVINKVDAADYYLSVYSVSDFEVSVYDMRY
jgi:transcriptional regulator with XRE-family HTH domain